MTQYKKEEILILMITETNNLPDLPRQHKKPEADFGVVFGNWLDEHQIFKTSSFEIKHTRGKAAFPLSEIKDKQLTYAMQIQGDRGVLIRVQGINGEPDYIYLKKEPAFIIIRYPKFWCVIPADDIAKEKVVSKSLSADRAKEISVFHS